MSNPSYTSTAAKPLEAPALIALLREMYEATPLHIFLTALKANSQR